MDQKSGSKIRKAAAQTSRAISPTAHLRQPLLWRLFSSFLIIANPRRICKRRFFLAIPRMRLGPRPKRLLQRNANPARKLLPRSGGGFRRPLARKSATAEGESPQPSLASLCLLSAGQKVGAPARPERVEGKIINLKKGKGITKVLGKIKKAYPAAQTG